MRTLLLLASIAFPLCLSAQELHTFSNGEVADAEKINENFENLKIQLGEIAASIPSNIGADTDFSGYVVVDVDCNQTADAFLTAHSQYRSEPQVRYRVTGSCDAELVDGVGTVLPIQIIEQTVIIEPGNATSSTCPSGTTSLTNEISVLNGALEVNCLKVGALRSFKGAIGLLNSDVDDIQGSSSVVRVRSLRGSATNIQLEQNSNLYLEAGLSGASLDVRLNQSTGVFVLERFVDSKVTLQGSSLLRCVICFGDAAQFTLDNGSRAEVNSYEDVQQFLALVGLPTTWGYLNIEKVALRPNAYFDYGALTPTEITETIRYEMHSAEDYQPASIANLPGSCSAEQDGSSVVITCADGTSGVLAGAGTVITYPEVATGQPIDYDVLPSGDTVVVDANGTVLGVARGVDNGRYDMSVTREGDGYGGELGIWNDEQTSTVGYGGARYEKIYYRDEECATEPFASTKTSIFVWDFVVIDIDGALYATNAWINQSALFKSYRLNGYDQSSSYSPTSNCVAKEEIRNGFNTLSPFTLPDDIVSAAYPVSLDQIP